MIRKGEFLVGEDQNGRIIASVYTEINGDRGYLGMLAVDPGRQGEGLGRAFHADLTALVNTE